MEESFEVRVKRLFGSKLFETVPKSSFPSSSWSVTNGEVERREWNRERGAGPDREDDPCSSAFYDESGCLSKRKKKSSADRKREFEGNLGDFDDEEEEEEEEEEGRGGGQEENDEEREEREIRSSVGLDPTLDNEDEEDEYDKAAVCRENAGERLYMRDVKDHGPYLNYHAIVPDFPDEPSEETHHFHKDPRADHFAATVRLKEDKVGTETYPLATRTNEEPARDSPVKIAEDDANLKPILKRKEAQIDSKPKKRVRFDPGCKIESNEVYEELPDVPMVPQSMETSKDSETCTSVREESAGVPDYIRNPSKYTHYTFDSSEKDDDETNKQAFADFLNLVKRSKSENAQHEYSTELPSSVTFTPRKKPGDAVPMDDSPGNAHESHKECGQVSGHSVPIAAGEADENDACEMDEDDMETTMVESSTGSRKGRQYRSKPAPGDSN